MSLLFPLTVKIINEKESKDAPYVAYTPELDISSCGPTEEKARQNLEEAVEILLEETEKKGRLNELMEELGFRKEKASWRPPRVSFEQFVFNLK
jgi:predicted RNase H-like HicB family nuclease